MVRAHVVSRPSLPASILSTRALHKCSCCAIGTGRLRTTATGSTTKRWRRGEEASIHAEAAALPPLLQRPQYPFATMDHYYPHKTNYEHGNHMEEEEEEEEEDQNNIIGDLATATDVLRLMDSLRLPVEEDLYLSLVKECTDTRDAVQGAKVHAHIQQNCGTLLRRPAGLLLANRLLVMYWSCGHPDSARLLFDQMPHRDTISWATMIAAISDTGSHREVLQLFADGWLVGELTTCCLAELITTVLRSCLRTGELGFGQQVHGLTLKMVAGDGDHRQLGSPLVQFYAMLGHHQSAQKVFDRMPSHDAAAWTCMINVCCRDGLFREALRTFRAMGRAGGRRNSYTHSSILPACARMEDQGWSGRQVHCHAIKVGVDRDQFVGSGLVDMYAKCGLLGDARRAFESTINRRDTVCWNAMLSGYAQRGRCTEAIRFLYEMKAAGIEPQESVLDHVRITCGS